MILQAVLLVVIYFMELSLYIYISINRYWEKYSSYVYHAPVICFIEELMTLKIWYLLYFYYYNS